MSARINRRAEANKSVRMPVSSPRCKLCRCLRLWCEGTSLWEVWRGASTRWRTTATWANLPEEFIHVRNPDVQFTMILNLFLGIICVLALNTFLTLSLSLCTQSDHPSPTRNIRPLQSAHDWWVSPLNCGISPVALFGRPLWQASLVSATVTPQLPNRNPICWLPASYWTIKAGGGSDRDPCVHFVVWKYNNTLL